jgi:hypothetical protein
MLRAGDHQTSAITQLTLKKNANDPIFAQDFTPQSD